MISGVGIDKVSVSRFAGLLERRPQTVGRLFNPDERAAGLSPQSLAARFAAKEATRKAVGRAVPWRDITVSSTSPAPGLTVDGDQSAFWVSFTHDGDDAIAVVVRERP